MAEDAPKGLRAILREMVVAKTSLMYLVTEEDRRVEGEIKGLASAFKPPLRVYVWSCTTGVTHNDEIVVPDSSIMDALDWFMGINETSFLIMNDIHVFLKDNPPVVRKFKDAVKRIENGYKAIFMLSPFMEIPAELSSDIILVDVPLPQKEEVNKLLIQVINSEKNRDTLMASLTDDLRDLFLKGGAGLTSQQATHAFRKVMMNKTSLTTKDLEVLFEEKRQIVKKSGLLELFRQDTTIDELGGFGNLKKWLELRKDIFSKRARDYGLSMPKGVLVMGISGCGKSLCVKAIADYWKLPLLRLDMGRVYDGVMGSPEECFRKVIKTSEASAPCVLWIDEIEAGIANAGQKSLGGAASRVLAAFLTWMQEKKSAVFIGATANAIELLPPEILRKGRFDELFYVDLPGDRDREEIVRIHLARHNVSTQELEYGPLVRLTQGFNGAEIEQGVLGALFRAFTQHRTVNQTDLLISLEAIVPLSTTMQEQIKALERWAHNRAIKAGTD
ncbi:MAG: AAA family ATPase [Pseudomonadota bacterium]